MKNTFKCIADCDMCGLCTVFKGKDPELAYDDYICGRREYMDVSDYNNKLYPVSRTRWVQFFTQTLSCQ